MSHKNFQDKCKLGEWFEVNFDEAVNFVKTACEKCGNMQLPQLVSVDLSSMFTLPTAMEDTQREDPIIYDWLVKNGYELYYCKYGIWVKGKDVDMPFEIFAKMVIA